MGHQHHWQSEPPQGRLSWKKSWDEQYGDEEDMADNAMSTSSETKVDSMWTRRRQVAVKSQLRMPAPKLHGGGAEEEEGAE